MKRFFTFLLLFVCSISIGQVNLVMNPSLEKYDTCPERLDEIKYAKQWMSLDSVWSPPDFAHAPPGVPEYCNICAGSNYFSGTPDNGRFFQFPRTGQGLSQVQMFYDETAIGHRFNRDYLQGHLTNTLIPGQVYCVSFYVALEFASHYAINNIGAYFDDGTIDTTHNPGETQTHITPQVFTTTIITDTLYWTKIQGSFIANGSERLITIGNFTDRAHTGFVVAPGRDTTGIGGGGVGAYSWYTVDDVCVMRSDATINAGADRVITGTDSVTIGDTLDTYLPTYWYANGSLIDSNTAWLRVRPDTTTMYVVELSRCGGDNITDTVWVYVGALFSNAPVYNTAAITLSPNPAHGLLTVDGAAHSEVTITDMVGREVFHTTVASAHEGIDISGIVPGLYMAQVVMPDGGRKCVRLAVQ